MITTLTLNPSLDYIVEVNDFQTGAINRTQSEKILPGGKGLNVSQVLKNLNADTLAVGIVAGFTGKALEDALDALGVKNDMIWARGMTRINVKVRSVPETAINGMGPEVDREILDALYAKLEGLGFGDTLVLAGKIAKGLPDDLYRRIMDRLEGKGIAIVVDAEGDQLASVLDKKPFLIKPNDEELQGLFGQSVQSPQDAIRLALKLRDRGVQNVLVSMGGDGAVLCAQDGKVYRAEAPQGQLVNSVGAGDSMVAGFLYGYGLNQDYAEGLKYGIAGGSASAFSENLATGEEIQSLAKRIEVKEMEVIT